MRNRRVGLTGATVCALEFFGPDRVLFASDWPFDPEKGPGYIRDTIKVLKSRTSTSKRAPRPPTGMPSARLACARPEARLVARGRAVRPTAPDAIR